MLSSFNLRVALKIARISLTQGNNKNCENKCKTKIAWQVREANAINFKNRWSLCVRLKLNIVKCWNVKYLKILKFLLNRIFIKYLHRQESGLSSICYCAIFNIYTSLTALATSITTSLNFAWKFCNIWENL